MHSAGTLEHVSRVCSTGRAEDRNCIRIRERGEATVRAVVRVGGEQGVERVDPVSETVKVVTRAPFREVNPGCFIEADEHDFEFVGDVRLQEALAPTREFQHGGVAFCLFETNDTHAHQLLSTDLTSDHLGTRERASRT